MDMYIIHTTVKRCTTLNALLCKLMTFPRLILYCCLFLCYAIPTVVIILLQNNSASCLSSVEQLPDRVLCCLLLVFLISREAKAAETSVCSIREKGVWMLSIFHKLEGWLLPFLVTVF